VEAVAEVGSGLCAEGGAMSHSLSDLLLRYAQQFEDQHAPQNMTIALREAAKEIDRLRAAAPHIKELYAIITDQAAEIEKLRNDVRLAVMSDGEECKLLTRINEALIAAPTVDVDVIVPDRDYSQMTPKDCYEAGLLDGVYQAREAIKKACRAALTQDDSND
jgi:hypothetical protein